MRLAAGVIGALLAAAPAQAAEREVVRLGTPAVLTPGAPLERTFTLPDGARQGPDRWYVVRLHYRVRFASGGKGFAWVTSDTNTRTSAQVEYTTSRAGVRRTTVDLEHGQRERRGRSRSDELTFTNYLQNAGVRAGANSWTLRLEQAGGASVKRLELLPDTAIVETDRSPFPLGMTVALDGDRPEAGEPFTIAVTLAARPGRSVDDVVVRADGGQRRRLGRVTERPRTVRFTFQATRAGTRQLTFAADSSANHPNASVQVLVLPSSRATAASPLVLGLAALPALAMVGWLGASRRRRRVNA
jgi:hypothetical protein